MTFCYVAVHDCEQYEEDGFMFFQCNIKTDMSTLETWGSAMMDLRNRLVDFQTQTDKIVDLLSLRNSNANQSALSVDLSQSSSATNAAGSSRTVSFHRSRSNSDEIETVPRPLTESELQRCSTLTLPKIEQMPTIFLLPDSSEIEYVAIGTK